MRLPMSWISRTGGTRYLLKTKMEFAIKSINGNWRPIVRKQLADNSASIFALGTYQHRDIFLHGGRGFFDHLCALRTTTPINPFGALKPRDFEFRQGIARTTLTAVQLADLMSTATSLAQNDNQ